MSERPVRPSTTARGYGASHQALRKQLAPLVAAGCCRCSRCGELIKPGELWDLDHNDLDRTRYNGPAHRHHNRATATRRARRTSREW
jgi:hypothetical protein